MSDPRLALVLKHLDPPTGFRPWHGGAGPLGALRGVPAEQATWKPAPDRHSIWELALHMAYWKYAVRRRVLGEPAGGFPRSPADWPAVPDPTSEEAWKEDRALVKESHTRLVEAVREFDAGRLDEPAGGTDAYTFADLLEGIVLHDAYHAGQIQIMKRIHRSLHGS